MGDDIFKEMMQARFLGPLPIDEPLKLPGVQERGNFRKIANQDPPDSAYAAPNKPILSPQDKARADFLVQKFAELLRNTNITASEPAHAVPMLWSTPIDLSAQVTLAGAAGDYQTVLTYTAPPGRWARIQAYGVDVDGSFTYNGSILWRLQLQNVNVQSLADWGQHRGSLIQPSETFVLVPQGQTITFQVKRAVAAGGPNQVAMVLKGYTWRLRDDYEGTKASVTAF